MIRLCCTASILRVSATVTLAGLLDRLHLFRVGHSIGISMEPRMCRLLAKKCALSSAPPFFKRESHCVWGLSRQLGLSERGVERSFAPLKAKNPLRR